MERCKNIKAFRELIDKYESINLNDVSNVGSVYKPTIIMNLLTGFGYKGTCSLCLAVNCDCRKCVYATSPDDNDDEGLYCTKDITYHNIVMSSSSEELLSAISERVRFMKTLLNKIVCEESNEFEGE